MQLPKFCLILVLMQQIMLGQHSTNMKVNFVPEENKLLIEQQFTYHNSSADTLTKIVFNDWNNAFSSKTSVLAQRFSDEFVRGFHLAKEEDRGATKIFSVIDANYNILTHKRPIEHIDLLEIYLSEPLLPNRNAVFTIMYAVKIPNAKFTKYGFYNDGYYNLKDWFFTPCTYQKQQFVAYSNENLDDITNASTNYNITLEVPKNYFVTSNLEPLLKEETPQKKIFVLQGKQQLLVPLILETEISFRKYKNNTSEITTNLYEKRLNSLQTALLIDKVTNFVTEKLGKSETPVLISQQDYDASPFYGINQLPSFINPFPDEMIYEIKFLKTYLNNFLQQNLQINNRKDHFIAEGIQQFLLMQYVDAFYPNSKMAGSLSDLKILKSYNFINTNFNEQFSYISMMMARNNLDQAIGADKNTLIKFNEQIAGKYKAGLLFRYLDAYMGGDLVNISLKEFVEKSKNQSTNRNDLQAILQKNTTKNINWVLDDLVETRTLIDYKIKRTKIKKDSILVQIRNKTSTKVPISLYGFSKKNIVFLQWIDGFAKDTIIAIPKKDIDKLVLNYNNEAPEINARNNFKKLNKLLFYNRPLKFNFFKDLEDPNYNQIFYTPNMEYNLYDGLQLGLRLNNKSMLNKPFVFDITPTYSPNTRSLVGKASIRINQNFREGSLYTIRYAVAFQKLHYAPDAAYTQLIPSVLFRFRDPDLRLNQNEGVQLKQYYINREKSNYITDANTESYTVFNAKYFKVKSETTKHFSYENEVQISNSFGKIATEIQYRKLFENNRRINVRAFLGAFIYRSTNSDFFSFAIDRPTDYLFNYDFIGRSESTGIFSQQYIIAEGGFKSKFAERYANQYIGTLNASFNIWNWIEIYSDAGFYKNKYQTPNFIYDSGIRLNLVPDYFEVYFPVYSSNGYELGQPNYDQKIRFTVTLSPKTLFSLFTRKWL